MVCWPPSVHSNCVHLTINVADNGKLPTLVLVLSLQLLVSQVLDALVAV